MPYQVTGNEYLSLPTIRESDGTIEGVTFLYMQLKGMLEIKGSDALMQPYFMVDGLRGQGALQWTREQHWIPSFSCNEEKVSFSCTYLTPMNERVLMLHLTVENRDAVPHWIRIGTSGSWDKTLHEINETAEISQGRAVYESGWNSMFIFSQAPALQLFAFAPCVADPQQFSMIDQGAQWTQQEFSYDIYKQATLQPGERMTLDIPWGIGYDGVSAATAAKEALRQGFDALHQRTVQWLKEREKKCADPWIEKLLNTNLFFSFFFASGRTIDTEELCLMTSRSPRYYVSAAYWDRDSLLWSFPAILSTDESYAKEILRYVFTRQARNFGIHSRYIDGTVLEPGFELDELCAPIIALKRYVDQTGDRAFVQQPDIQEALCSILRKLEGKKHPRIDLYETFLQPSDDMHSYRYLTYDNALVCFALRALADFLNMDELWARAERTQAAVYEWCVRGEQNQRYFVWSVDLLGECDVYDEPPGSLQLLPFYGFCPQDDQVWQNTIRMIRSKEYPLSFAGYPIAEIGCKHAPHPWILAICNSLLSGYQAQAMAHLHRTELDNGIACESVNEITGKCETGPAFATCAGFLSYALLQATQTSIS